MDIPNLSQTKPLDNSSPIKKTTKKKSLLLVGVVLLFAIISGFWVSRFWPSQNTISLDKMDENSAISAENISPNALETGVVYGNSQKNFKDIATGVIEEGNINGEGTHILAREGGDSQRVSLTSSTVDLDLFVDKKVEVKGETNTSNKTAWLLDVGSIKIIE